MANYRIVKITYPDYSVFRPQKLVLGLFWISIWSDGEVFPEAPVKYTIEAAEMSILKNKKRSSIKKEIIHFTDNEECNH